MSKGKIATGGAVVALIAIFTVCAITPVGLIGIAMLATLTGSSDSSCSGNDAGTSGLTAEQTANLQVIVSTVSDRGLDASDAVIAVMTALTESSLVNVTHGDQAGPDSTGLFQQRDSWGSREVREDPAGATGLFLDALTADGLKTYGTNFPVNSAAGSRKLVAPWLVAQSVQRSAYSDGSNYFKNYDQAVAAVSTILSADEMSAANTTAWSSVTIDGVDLTSTVTGAASTSTSVTCTNSLTTGTTSSGAGAWGGYANGQIPDSALSAIPWASGHRLRADAVQALTELNEAFRARFGVDIAITDSYRSYDEQVAVKAAKGWLAATPGTSNHGWALAVDLGGGIQTFGSEQHQWMVSNAGAYGWTLPSWAQQNGSKPEAWHWEYTG